jgi:WD40 repeat protein
MSLAFNHDGSKIVSGWYNETICVWDVATGQCIKEIKGKSTLIVVDFNHDGSKILSVCKNAIKIWDVDTWKCILKINKERDVDEFTCAAFNHDGSRIVSGSGNVGTTIKIWNVESGKSILSFECQGFVESVEFNHDGSLVAIAQRHTWKNWKEWEGIIIWNVNTNKVILKKDVKCIQSVTFNYNGSLIASGSGIGPITSGASEKKIRVWNVATGECISTFKCNGPVQSIDFNHNGSLIAAGQWDGIQVWDVNTGKVIFQKDSKKKLFSVKFNHDGSRLAFVDDNDSRKISVWDTSSDVIELPCKHQFHTGCICKFLADWEADERVLKLSGMQKSVETKPFCPLCKVKLDLKIKEKCPTEEYKKQVYEKLDMHT